MFHFTKTTCIINLKLFSYFLQVETQILNIKPAFILPAVEIIDEECYDNKEEKDGEGGEEEKDEDVKEEEGESRRRTRRSTPVVTCGGVYRYTYIG